MLQCWRLEWQPACSSASQSIWQTFKMSQEKQYFVVMMVNRYHKDAPGCSQPHCIRPADSGVRPLCCSSYCPLDSPFFTPQAAPVSPPTPHSPLSCPPLSNDLDNGSREHRGHQGRLPVVAFLLPPLLRGLCDMSPCPRKSFLVPITHFLFLPNFGAICP